ncbi:type I-E CRISPR-associated protein Cse2/CasB [Nocardiopsis sp. NPDC050513]|uniref:type I-E CRISPR-associated protein Cse2/CasB n=1 Tax=Nocardiopsis sp. NPDC050513 TaxID=3364338 RepID=UPI00378AFF89
MNTPEKPPRRHYWERFTPDDAYAGKDLAHLRQGLGRNPGEAPAMLRHYTTLNRAGRLTPELVAEHAALSLFGLHQQSKGTHMHRVGIGVGDAALELRNSKDRSDESIDNRMNAAATSSDPEELIGHLRGLVRLLSQAGQPLDYTRLYDDIRAWHYPEDHERITRRWGGQYWDRRRR